MEAETLVSVIAEVLQISPELEDTDDEIITGTISLSSLQELVDVNLDIKVSSYQFADGSWQQQIEKLIASEKLPEVTETTQELSYEINKAEF